jgi:hypothetical protein
MYGSGAIPQKIRGNGVVPQIHHGLPVYGNVQIPPEIYESMRAMQRLHPVGPHYGPFYGKGGVMLPMYGIGRNIPKMYGNRRRPPTKYDDIWRAPIYRNGGGSFVRGNVAEMVEGGNVDNDGHLRPVEGTSHLYDSTAVPDEIMGENVPPPEFSEALDAMSGGNENHCGGKLMCKLGEYTCLESCTCIPAHLRCDGDADCDGEEDEMECGDDLEGDADEDCNSNNGDIRCSRTGRCIRHEWLCDGKDDCGDFSDETRCGK